MGPPAAAQLPGAQLAGNSAVSRLHCVCALIALALTAFCSRSVNFTDIQSTRNIMIALCTSSHPSLSTYPAAPRLASDSAVLHVLSRRVDPTSPSIRMKPPPRADFRARSHDHTSSGQASKPCQLIGQILSTASLRCAGTPGRMARPGRR